MIVFMFGWVERSAGFEMFLGAIEGCLVLSS